MLTSNVKYLQFVLNGLKQSNVPGKSFNLRKEAARERRV